MSWLFSQALGVEYSAGICSDGELSAPLSVMPTQHKFSRNDKTIDASQLSRFGLTCAVLTEDRGAELLTSYLAASRARTSAKLAPALESRVNALDCGSNSLGSFAKFDPSTSSWKTAQCSLFGGLASFSETWPNWGSIVNGESFLRPPWEPTTCAIEPGLWQTPVADDAVSRAAGKWNSRGEPKLSAQVKIYPTPTTIGLNGGSNSRRARKNRGESELHLGLLNPEWTEWLMGWPIGWTELKPLEMGKFLAWRQQHSLSWQGI